jgi:uncharacterized membrane protein YbhN (UPF0104 family)
MKLAIVVGALYFIYNKTVLSNPLNLNEFTQQLKVVLLENAWTIPILLLLTFFNWFFEILKWKNLVKILKKITIFESTQQSLASLTTSLFTPNRIGEYGAKAVYYKKNKRKIMLLNLVGNLNQLTVTIIFGIIGLVFFLSTYEVEINPYRLRRLGYLIGFIILLGLGNKRLKLFEFLPWKKIREFVKKIPFGIHLKVFLYSSIRYLIFSHQFYFLLLVFGVEESYFTLISLILSMYIIASFIPSISLFDWAIKGTVAIYIFSFTLIPEITIVIITLLMWILNFALPSIIGSYYVLNFKLPKK